MKKILLGFILLISLQGQNNTQLALSDADRARYWRAQYEMAAKECEASTIRTNWQATIADLSKKCGALDSTTVIVLDQQGEPSCPVQK